MVDGISEALFPEGVALTLAWIVCLGIGSACVALWNRVDTTKQPWAWIDDHLWIGVVVLLVIGGILIVTGVIWWSPFTMYGG